MTEKGVKCEADNLNKVFCICFTRLDFSKEKRKTTLTNGKDSLGIMPPGKVNLLIMFRDNQTWLILSTGKIGPILYHITLSFHLSNHLINNIRDTSFIIYNSAFRGVRKSCLYFCDECKKRVMLHVKFEDIYSIYNVSTN